MKGVDGIMPTYQQVEPWNVQEHHILKDLIKGDWSSKVVKLSLIEDDVEEIFNSIEGNNYHE